jgi:hypothetical protein
MTAAVATLQNSPMEGRISAARGSHHRLCHLYARSGRPCQQPELRAATMQELPRGGNPGEHFSLFYLPEDRVARLPEKALATAASAGRFVSEGWRRRKDETPYCAHVVIDAIRDLAGQLLGSAKITRDLVIMKTRSSSGPI